MKNNFKFLFVVPLLMAAQVAIGQSQFWSIAENSGPNNKGFIYRANNDGTNVQVEYQMTRFNQGVYPGAFIIDSVDCIVGTTSRGGIYNKGTIFRYNISTDKYTKLFDFDGIDGNFNSPKFCKSPDGMYYGVSERSGNNQKGCLFKFNTANNTFTRLIDFWDGIGNFPNNELIYTDSCVYGFTASGGTNSKGTIFKYNIISNKFKVLYHFKQPLFYNPIGKLMLDSSGMIYGLSTNGGDWGRGAIYKINPSNDSLSVYYSFSITSNIQKPFWDNCITEDNRIYSFCFIYPFNYLFEFNIASKQLTIIKPIYENQSGLWNYYLDILDSNKVSIGLIEPYSEYFDFRYYDRNTDSIFNVFSLNSPYSSLMMNPVKYNYSGSSNGQYLFAYNNQSSLGGGIGIYDSISDSISIIKNLADSFPDENFNKLMVHSDGKLYGTSSRGGVNNVGTIFKYDADLAELKVLYNFKGYDTNFSFEGMPFGQLHELSSGKLLGTMEIENNKLALFTYDLGADSVSIRQSYQSDNNHYGQIVLSSIGNDIFLGAYDGTLNYPNGFVFLYDALMDSTTILHAFNGSLNSSVYGTPIEVAPGVFMGHNSSYLYKYSVATKTFIKQSFLMNWGANMLPNLVQDDKGYIYGICTDYNSFHKGIFKINLQMDTIDFVYDFDTVSCIQNITSIQNGFEKSDNGKFYMVFHGSFIEYCPSTNTLTHVPTNPSSPFLIGNSDRITLAPTSVGFPNANKSNSNGEICIYPNPVNDILNIHLKNKSTGKINVEIYTVLGKKLYEKSYMSNDVRINLNQITHKIKSAFIVKISTSTGEVYYRKVIGY